MNYGTCSATDTVKINVIPSRTFNDMQALSFSTSNTTPVRGPISIQANFKNLGKPAKNFIVALSANGTFVSIDTVNLTNSLWPDSTYTHTFRAPWIPGTQVTNTLCAIVAIASDQNIQNDTTCSTFLSGVNAKNNVINSLKIYPNPAKNWVQVELGDLDIMSARILDIQGREVRNLSQLKGQKTATVSLEGIQDGTYIFEVKSKQGISITRLVKE